MMKNQIANLYKELLEIHGSQGWWPLLSQNNNGEWRNSYHPGNYDLPQTDEQKLEIAIGAILTQNTTWKNAVKALINLKNENIIDPAGFNRIKQYDLAEIIKPSGYYNQKARKIKEFIKLWNKLNGKTPKRDELLKVWGIGPETADSILLYAYKIPTMVIDAYTFRIFIAENIIPQKIKYHDLKHICEESLPKDYTVIQEFHALLVKAGKSLK